MTIISTDKVNFANILESIEEKLNSTPRKWKKSDKVRSMGLIHNLIDPLQRAYKDQKFVFENGKLCWGYIVQANSLLFTKQDKVYPANIVFSHSKEIHSNPLLLRDVARSLYSLKHTNNSQQEIQTFVDSISSELERKLQSILPSVISGPNEMRFTCINIDPNHLPLGLLSSSLLPVITYPKNYEAFPATIAVPYTYWPDELLKFEKLTEESLCEEVTSTNMIN